MSKHISIVFGIISGYSFNRDNLTLSMNISVRIEGHLRSVSFQIPAYGKEYDFFGHKLCLYRKDGTVNLEFLNETYIMATMVEDAGTFTIKEIQLDAIMYQ